MCMFAIGDHRLYTSQHGMVNRRTIYIENKISMINVVVVVVVVTTATTSIIIHVVLIYATRVL